jgi:hypothetical protein
MPEWTGGLTAFSIAMVAGCGGSPAQPQLLPVPAAPEAAVDCPKTGCGLNGSWLGENIPFRELDLGNGRTLESRQRNSAGLRIHSIKKDGDSFQKLEVDGDQLVGFVGKKSLRGADLIGTEIKLIRDYADLKGKVHDEHYTLRIEAVSYTSFWTEARTGPWLCAPFLDDMLSRPGCDRVPLYTIKFTKDGDSEKDGVNLCSPLLESNPTLAPAIDGTVIVFRGDRYEDAGYTVHIEPDSTWFNIACAGTALGKMHLLRHTTAGSREHAWGRGNRVTTLPQRQTLLRMLTGDYCGVGVPFTVDGHHLSYTFHQQWEPLQPRSAAPEDAPVLVPFKDVRNASIDALWYSGGAACIGTPRRSDEKSEAALEEKIRRTCSKLHSKLRPDRGPSYPPDCDTLQGSLSTWDPSVLDDDRPYAVSANPQPFTPRP